MAQGRRPKGPRGGQFTGKLRPEGNFTLYEDIERVISDTLDEANEPPQLPPPKTEDAKEARIKATLDEIEQRLDLAGQFVADGREKMQSSIERRLAVERLFENLGEQAKRLPDRYRRERYDMDWKGLIGLRDWLSHGYGLDINEEILWHALTVDLPALRAQLARQGRGPRP